MKSTSLTSLLCGVVIALALLFMQPMSSSAAEGDDTTNPDLAQVVQDITSETPTNDSRCASPPCGGGPPCGNPPCGGGPNK